jgi:hypothetical protein
LAVLKNAQGCGSDKSVLTYQRRLQHCTILTGHVPSTWFWQGFVLGCSIQLSKRLYFLCPVCPSSTGALRGRVVNSPDPGCYRLRCPISTSLPPGSADSLIEARVGSSERLASSSLRLRTSISVLRRLHCLRHPGPATFRSMAAKRPRPSDTGPHWLQAFGARHAQDSAAATHSGASSSSAARPLDRPQNATEPTAGGRGEGSPEVLTPRQYMASVKREFRDMRFDNLRAASFAPERHVGYVLGRPVVVPSGRTRVHRWVRKFRDIQRSIALS